MTLTKTESTILDQHFAELYHTGMSLIPTWKLLHMFRKDEKRLTKAFFRDEIISRWDAYISDVEYIHISVHVVRADHSVLKPVSYLLTRDKFRYTGTGIDIDDESQEENQDD
ncbi:hypothetical protein PS850_06216 [Pseudomonas fluorescens]|nr:hypothetical protein PS850_06216 [Pseudomonas fluorescens]